MSKLLLSLLLFAAVRAPTGGTEPEEIEVEVDRAGCTQEQRDEAVNTFFFHFLFLLASESAEDAAITKCQLATYSDPTVARLLVEATTAHFICNLHFTYRVFGDSLSLINKSSFQFQVEDCKSREAAQAKQPDQGLDEDVEALSQLPDFEVHDGLDDALKEPDTLEALKRLADEDDEWARQREEAAWRDIDEAKRRRQSGPKLDGAWEDCSPADKQRAVEVLAQKTQLQAAVGDVRDCKHQLVSGDNYKFTAKVGATDYDVAMYVPLSGEPDVKCNARAAEKPAGEEKDYKSREQKCSDNQREGGLREALAALGLGATAFSANEVLRCTYQFSGGILVKLEFGADEAYVCAASVLYPMFGGTPVVSATRRDCLPRAQDENHIQQRDPQAFHNPFDMFGQPEQPLRHEDRAPLGQPSEPVICEEETLLKALEVFKEKAPQGPLKEAQRTSVDDCTEQFSEGTLVKLEVSGQQRQKCHFSVTFDSSGKVLQASEVRCGD